MHSNCENRFYYMREHILSLPNKTATIALGIALAKVCNRNYIIYLYGDIGTGKTTFCRGFLHGLGHYGQVKSPTYTLVESYKLYPFLVYHFDLYRLVYPEELNIIGIRDYFIQNAICLVEWPQHGAGVLPEADLEIYITHCNPGRTVKIQAVSVYGSQLLESMQE